MMMSNPKYIKCFSRTHRVFGCLFLTILNYKREYRYIRIQKRAQLHVTNIYLNMVNCYYFISGLNETLKECPFYYYLTC
jgi:hypothetical protein